VSINILCFAKSPRPRANLRDGATAAATERPRRQGHNRRDAGTPRHDDVGLEPELAQGHGRVERELRGRAFHLSACLTEFADVRPSCFAGVLDMNDDADVAWFCGTACAGVRGVEETVHIAWTRAQELFLFVSLSDQPTATAAELERLLPSHFLRLAQHHRGRDGPRRRAPAKVDRAREAAFVAANAADAAFYERARDAFTAWRFACHIK